MEREFPVLLKKINPRGFLVAAFLKEDVGGREDYIQLDGESLKI